MFTKRNHSYHQRVSREIIINLDTQLFNTKSIKVYSPLISVFLSRFSR